MLPFFKREPYALTFRVRHRDVDLIKHTNLDDYTMTACMLVSEGFGSKAEIDSLDTDDFLDLVEFVQIRNAIQQHQIDEARADSGNS